MISTNVIVMTSDELRDRLEAEFRRGVESAAVADYAALLSRSSLKNTAAGVIFSSDGTARIAIGQAFDANLGDCLTIQWMMENGNPKGHWLLGHFSPARARLVARELILRAVSLEEVNGTKPIDPIPEKMRKGPIGV